MKIVWKFCLIVGLLLESCFNAAEAVECYVCSWTPSETHRVDICSRRNFSASRVITHTCEYGCESTSIFNRNGEMEVFYRNCARKPADSLHIDVNCYNQTQSAILKETCSCIDDLCNTSSRANYSVLIILTFITTALSVL